MLKFKALIYAYCKIDGWLKSTIDSSKSSGINVGSDPSTQAHQRRSKIDTSNRSGHSPKENGCTKKNDV